MRLYAGDMNLNRKDDKSMSKYKKLMFRTQKGENVFYFLVKILIKPMGYLASIMF